MLVRNDNWNQGDRRLPAGAPGPDRGEVRPRHDRHRPAPDPGRRRGQARADRGRPDRPEQPRRRSSATTGSPTGARTSSTRTSGTSPSTQRRCRTSSTARRSPIAMDRAQLRTVAGGEFAGDLGDGVIKPNLPADYAPSGMFTDLLGQEVPDTGDPDAAKQLIADSGEPMPTLQYDYPQTTGQRQAGGVAGRVDGQGRHQDPAEPDRGRPVLRHRARPGQGGPPGRGPAGDRTGRTPRR